MLKCVDNLSYILINLNGRPINSGKLPGPFIKFRRKYFFFIFELFKEQTVCDRSRECRWSGIMEVGVRLLSYYWISTTVAIAAITQLALYVSYV